MANLAGHSCISFVALALGVGVDKSTQVARRKRGFLWLGGIEENGTVFVSFPAGTTTYVRRRPGEYGTDRDNQPVLASLTGRNVARINRRLSGEAATQ